MKLINACALTESFIHDELSFRCGIYKLFSELIKAHLVEIFNISESVSSFFKRTDSLLESLLVGLTDTHDLTDCSHLGSEMVRYSLEFFECPSCELDYNIISVGLVIIKSAVLTALDILKIESACEHCGYKSDGESCSLGSKSGGS